MKLRLEPITAIIVSVLLGWGWTKATSQPTCEVQTKTESGQVIVEYYPQEYCDKLKMEAVK